MRAFLFSTVYKIEITDKIICRLKNKCYFCSARSSERSEFS